MRSQLDAGLSACLEEGDEALGALCGVPSSGPKAPANGGWATAAGRGGAESHGSPLSLRLLIQGKINPHGPGAICVDGIQVGGNLVPDGANHIPLFAGVNISCALSHPVAQVLALIPGDLGLKSTVRHKDPEGMPRKIHPQVLLEFLAGQSRAKPVESTFRRGRSGNKPIIVLPNRGDEVVHAFEHRRSSQFVVIKGVHQSLPEKEYFGQMRGTGFFLTTTAEWVFVCHAASSTVVEVTLRVSGFVCWRSLNRALVPSWKRTIPQMKESIEWILDSDPEGGLAAVSSTWMTKALEGTVAFLVGRCTVLTRVSERAFFFSVSLKISSMTTVCSETLPGFQWRQRLTTQGESNSPSLSRFHASRSPSARLKVTSGKRWEGRPSEALRHKFQTQESRG